MSESIECHSKYLSQLHSQVEQPLRNSKSLGPINLPKLKALEDQLNRSIKSYEESELKLNRSTSKLNSSSNIRKVQALQTRYSEDQQAFHQSQQAWFTQLPQVFKVYQSIDHDRLVDLLETLTKLETLQADHSRQLMEIYQRSAESLLSFDPREDIQRFVLLNGSISDLSTLPNPSHRTHSNPQPLPPSALTSSSPPSIHQATPAPNHSRQPTVDSPPPETTHQPIDLPTSLLTTTSEAHHSNSDLLPTALPKPSPDQPEPSTSSKPQQPPTRSSTAPLPASPSKPWSATGNGYDPNHPEIPKLNAPNISVPIRTTPLSSPNPSHNPLPPRTLYVQRQNSNSSLSNQRANGSTPPIDRSARPNTQALKNTAAAQSITDKLFSRSRLTNILSRNGHSNLNLTVKPPQSRRLSQTTPSYDLHENEADRTNTNERTSPTDRSRQRRSSSMMNTSSHPGLYALDQSQITPTTPPVASKPSWSTTRLAQFLPGSTPLLKSKISYSNRLRNKPSLSKPELNLKVDSEGFTVPPENRDRMPWEQEGDTEILSLEGLEGSTHQIDSSRSNQDHDEAERAINPGSGILNSFAIKSSPSPETLDTEAERLAAIQKVQNTLASSVGSTSAPMNQTRRQNAALRGRRADGRGATMYDVSPAPSFHTPSPLVRRGTVADRSVTSKLDPPLKINPPKADSIYTLLSLSLSMTSQLDQKMIQPSGSVDENLTQPLPSSSQQPSTGSMIRHHTSITSDVSASSRSNSVTSALSNTNLSHHGFQAVLPTINGNEPSIATSPNAMTAMIKNPFLSMSLSSLSNRPPPPSSSSSASMDKVMSPGIESVAGHSSQLGIGRGRHYMSVSEKLNVLMDQTRVTKFLVIGEVNIMKSLIDRVLNPTSQHQESSHSNLRFKIHHLDRLEKFVFPGQLVSPISEHPGEFEFDLIRFKALCSRSPGLKEQGHYCVLKYRLYFDPASRQDVEDGASKADDPVKRYIPLVVIPRWRVSKEKTELVLNYKESLEFQKFYVEQHQAHGQRREEARLDGLEPPQPGQPKEKRMKTRTKDYEDVVIEDFELSTMIFNPELEKSHTQKLGIIDQQSLPKGRFDRTRNRIEWNLTSSLGSGSKLRSSKDSTAEVTPTIVEEGEGGVAGMKLKGLNGKVVCRFIHDPYDPLVLKNPSDDLRDGDSKSKENCGPIEVKWNLHGINLTGIRIEIINPSDLSLGRDRREDPEDDLDTEDDREVDPAVVFHQVSTSTFLCR